MGSDRPVHLPLPDAFAHVRVLQLPADCDDSLRRKPSRPAPHVRSRIDASLGSSTSSGDDAARTSSPPTDRSPSTSAPEEGPTTAALCQKVRQKCGVGLGNQAEPAIRLRLALVAARARAFVRETRAVIQHRVPGAPADDALWEEACAKLWLQASSPKAPPGKRYRSSHSIRRSVPPR